MGQRPTIKDIVEHTGISSSTISRVLNNEENVHEATRERVERAISELGYRPHPVASALKSGRGRLVHIIPESDDAALMPAMLAGVADRATETGYRLIFSTLAYERRAVHIDERLIDGVIFIPDFEHSVSLDWLQRDISVPVVCLYGSAEAGSIATSIVSDDYGGAKMAVRHLVSTGRREIAYVNGVTQWIQSQHRYQGYIDALREAGLEVKGELIQQGDWSRGSGYTACERLLRAGTFDAIYSANDKMAAGILHCLSDHSVGVPDQVAVVGFDDRDLCQFVTPPLTSIALPLREMGRLAFDSLMESRMRLERGEQLTDRIIRVPCRLVERESTRGGISATIDATSLEAATQKGDE